MEKCSLETNGKHIHTIIWMIYLRWLISKYLKKKPTGIQFDCNMLIFHIPIYKPHSLKWQEYIQNIFNSMWKREMFTSKRSADDCAAADHQFWTNFICTSRLVRHDLNNLSFRLHWERALLLIHCDWVTFSWNVISMKIIFITEKQLVSPHDFKSICKLTDRSSTRCVVCI